MSSEVREGLSRVLADVPLRAGYVEAQAGWSASAGGFGRLEAGAHLTPSSSAFAFAQLDRSGPWAGLGYRWTFDF